MKKLTLNIDGHEVTGFTGQTILEVARRNNIEIPTLCFDERLSPYGGCGLCVVEIEGSPKLFRACATEIASGMVVTTDSPRIRASRKTTLELLLSDHRGDCRPPCMLSCPAKTDCQGYVGLIANGRYRDAVALIKEKLPLPASIGRICPHPCEAACRRQLVEEPVAIAALKAFVGDWDLKSGNPYLPEVKPPTGKKVAIVGSGPAGLTAAYFLAREGHELTIFEAMPKPGGMLRYGIPQYRLPKEILDEEIKLITSLGVRIVTNTKIGRDISLDYLKKNYDAVFIGIGAWKSSALGCPGEDLEGVVGGIDFLRKVAMHSGTRIGERVVVVGGGNTAMDAARTAVRLGAGQVMVLYRRTRAEMPAEDIEVQEAMEEGVEFRFLVSPLEVLGDGRGKVRALRLQRMQLGDPDASGRRRPVPIPGVEVEIPVETVISAIGQQVTAAGLDGLELTQKGTIAVDPATLQTNIPGVFAGGDAVTGPGIAIEAVAQGQRAAAAINSYLAGKLEAPREIFAVTREDLTTEDFAEQERIPRAAMSRLSVPERKTNFREVNKGLSEKDAVTEAKRCLECGCLDYFECKLAAYAGEYGAQPARLEGAKHREEFHDRHTFIERNSEKCILCGLCVRICDEVMGSGVLGLVNRGFDTVIKPECGLPLAETKCLSCGQCVAVCPTGALVERLAIDKQVPLVMDEKQSLCSFCSMGCEQVYNVRGGLVGRALPGGNGLLCWKGRFGFTCFNRDRLKEPLVRVNGKLEEISWQEALTCMASGVERIRARAQEDALAVLVSPSYTLEEASAAANFGRLALGTKRLGSLTRNLAGYSTVEKWEEILATDLVLMVGSFAECQVTAVRAREAARRGVKLVILSGEPTLADDLADFKVVPFNSTRFLKEVLAAVVEKGYPLDGGLQEVLCGVEPSVEAKKVADLYAAAGKAIILIDGYTVSESGTQLLSDLALVTGKTGSHGNGLFVVSPGGNAAGLWRLGIRMAFADVLADIRRGTCRGLFIFGEDPVGTGICKPSDLEGLELLVAVTPRLTPTAEIAGIVLPGTTPLESAGHYLFPGGQFRKRGMVQPPLAGKDNTDLILDLAGALNTVLPAVRFEEIPAEDKQKPGRDLTTRDGPLFEPTTAVYPALYDFSR
ncbi:MAG TPA: FAD-dependent oxidoreductase [Syntrophomonadaceae bacterium]|nr:FAD-dependent oxidoreductase [Syntrophomonadaceae bacterium]